MTQVRLFFIKLTLLLVLIASILAGTIFLIPPDPDGYFQASLYKLDILNRTPSPRIIVVGGSNVAFGVDSQMLESGLGIPVVNMGLHAGLGENSYKEVRGYIRPGDIILLMPEYSMFRTDDVLKGNDLALSQWIEYDLTRLRLVDPGRVPRLIQTIVQVKATRRLVSLLNKGQLDRSGYTSDQFNRWGDFTGQLGATEPIKNLGPEPYLYPGDFNLHTYQFFEKFNQDALAKGAIVYLEFPASRGINCLSTGEAQFQTLYNNLKKLTTIPIITDMKDLCFPNADFFDNIQHLNGVGRELMTERLIRDLRPFIPQ